MFQDHHVLSQKFASHPVIRILGERFNHDAIRNLIALPSSQQVATELSSSPHTGGHLGTYYKGFCEHLEELKTSARFAAASAGDARALDEVASDVNAIVDAAKYAIARGHLFPNTPKGMMPDEANDVNREWFSNWRKYAADNAEQIRQTRETVDQLYNAGQRKSALRYPLLDPTSDLGMAERIEILKRFPEGSPISLQFTGVGPVPDLPGLVPPPVDTRLPGFIPPPLEGLNKPEGFTPSDPFRAYGLPGFPIPPSDWQRLTRMPPSTAMPPEPQVSQFHPETGRPLTYLSDGSQVLGPQPAADQRTALLMAAGVLGAGVMMVPGLQGLGGALLGGAFAGAATVPALGKNSSRDIKSADGSVFSTGATSYNPFELDRPAPHPAGGSGNPFAISSGPLGRTLSPEADGAGTFLDRFGNWIDTPAGAMPAQSPQETPAAPAAGVAAADEVRRLARVNASNAGSVFTSGSAPVPYLPSPEGSAQMPIGQSLPQRASGPSGALADEPSYLIPPPIFGVHDVGNFNNDAEQWFSRWVRPFIRSE